MDPTSDARRARILLSLLDIHTGARVPIPYDNEIDELQRDLDTIKLIEYEGLETCHTIRTF
jgi:hypothetical protein